MAELKRWQELPRARRRRPRTRSSGRPPATGARPGSRSSTRRSASTASSAGCTAPTRRSCSTGTTLHRHRLRLCKGCELCVEVCPAGAIEMVERGGLVIASVQPRLLTGGEAVAHAMRQIDPDVVPVYPITPQTPIIQTFSKFVADGARDAEIVNVESEHSAMSAAIGSALAGARTITATSSQGLALMAEVVYIAASMRAPIVMAVGNRALSGPINIHCDHSDSMLVRDSGVRAAVRRERAGGVRPDGDRAAARRASRTCCCRCSSARTASRSPTRPSRSSCSPTTTCARFVGDYRLAASAARRRAPVDAGPVRDARLLLRAAAPAGRGARARRRRFDELAAEFERLTGRRSARVEAYALDGAETRDRRARLDRRHGQGRRRRAARRGRARRPAEDPLVPPVPRRRASGCCSRTSTPSSCSTAPTRPAERRRSSPRSPPRSTAAAAELRSHVYGLGGRDLHPEDVRDVFAGDGARATSACEVRRVPPEDARPQPARRRRRCAAATRSARAAASRWSCARCSTRSTRRSSSSTRPAASRSRRRASRRPPGTSLAARRVRERRCGRERRRGAQRALASQARAAGRRGGHGRRLRRRRRHLRHRPAGAVRRARARPPLPLRLLRQRGVHEHGRPALRRDTVRREHDDEPRRRSRASARRSSART